MKVLKNIEISLLLFVFLTLSVNSLTAQSKIGVTPPPFKSLEFQTFKAPNLRLEIAPNYLFNSNDHPSLTPPPFNSPLAEDMLTLAKFANVFQHSNMPFFCKMEFQMEQATKFPVRIRLGEVDYVDRLEGKREWYDK